MASIGRPRKNRRDVNIITEELAMLAQDPEIDEKLTTIEPVIDEMLSAEQIEENRRTEKYTDQLRYDQRKRELRAEKQKQAEALRKRARKRKRVEAAGGVVKTVARYAHELEPKPEEISQKEHEENLLAEAQVQVKLRAAVIASLYLGQSIGQVAAQYDLPYQRVKYLKESFEEANSVQRRDWLTDMLLVYIQQEIKSLMAISMVTSNEEWVMDQNAADLALYIATKSDKLTQLLQSFGRVSKERDQYVDQLQTVVERMPADD